MKGGGSTRNNEWCLDRGERRYRDYWKGKTSQSHRQLFHPWVGNMALHYLVFLVQQLERMLGKGKELSQISMPRTTSPIGVRTSKLNRSSAWSEMTLSWITEQDGYMKTWVRSWWHGSKVDRYHVRYLLEINDTRALIGKMVDVCETTIIWLDDRCEPRGTLGWEWTMCKHYLGRSSRALKQTKDAFDH
jgi:hypothetical protein